MTDFRRQNAMRPGMWVVTALAVALAGCGGGGGETATAPVQNPPPVQTPSNDAPTISGSPAASVAVGQAYTFTPSASDANSDTLTFSIANKPSWATFTASTGQLTGTPAAGDVASYSNIIISVSDGKAASVALPAFSIAVNQISTGSAMVSWTPPTTNTDGTAVSLTGYRVYYGTSATALTQSIQAGVNVTSQLVSNLSPATWYFVVRAINSTGTESDDSVQATKVIQ
jgi:hypothetical protein